jgi:hypothetical protein
MREVRNVKGETIMKTAVLMAVMLLGGTAASAQYTSQTNCQTLPGGRVLCNDGMGGRPMPDGSYLRDNGMKSWPTPGGGLRTDYPQPLFPAPDPCRNSQTALTCGR